MAGKAIMPFLPNQDSQHCLSFDDSFDNPDWSKYYLHRSEIAKDF